MPRSYRAGKANIWAILDGKRASIMRQRRHFRRRNGTDPVTSISTASDDEFRDAQDRILAVKDLELAMHVELYALYQQATHGNAPTKAPPIFNEVDRLKFIAWAKRRHMPTWEAKKAYVDLVDKLMAPAT
jgi:acyl-CoA-binding protein